MNLRPLLAAGAVVLAIGALGAAMWLRTPPEVTANGVDGGPSAEKRTPNVLLILWDTTRADRLSLYGHDRPTTPRLEAFAKDATVYDHAWSPGIWTLAAHASVFTGLPVEATGADERWIWLDNQHVTLAEHLTDHGYDSFSFAANTLLAKGSNLTQGFRVVFNTWQPQFKRKAYQATQAKLIPGDVSNELTEGWQRPDHGAKNHEWGRAEFKEAGPLIGKGLLHWLDVRRDKEQPWIAYLNLMEAHTPRIPSMAARKAVLKDDDLIQRGLTTDQGHINLHFYNFGKFEYTAEELEAINGVYDASLRDLDDATGDLLDALAARGELDDTIVILTADHGENLGDHHLFNHRFALYETLLHVPLVIRYPKGMEPGRVTEPVSTMDLYATVCDLIGIAPPPGIMSRSLKTDERRPPVSFIALPQRSEIQTVRNVYPDVEIEPWMRQGHATVSGMMKLIDWHGRDPELYDLSADPGELNNLAATRSEDLGRLKQVIASRVAETPVYDRTRRGTDDDPGGAGGEEMKKQLEALGYLVEDDEGAGDDGEGDGGGDGTEGL